MNNDILTATMKPLIRQNFINFTRADNEFNPICLKGKHWELIKLDIVQALAGK